MLLLCLNSNSAHGEVMCVSWGFGDRKTTDGGEDPKYLSEHTDMDCSGPCTCQASILPFEPHWCILFFSCFGHGLWKPFPVSGPLPWLLYLCTCLQCFLVEKLKGIDGVRAEGRRCCSENTWSEKNPYMLRIAASTAHPFYPCSGANRD
jgi:hypothetical protein